MPYKRCKRPTYLSVGQTLNMEVMTLMPVLVELYADGYLCVNSTIKIQKSSSE